MADPMPYEPSLPCAECARGVDPLRARAVLALDDGFRYFCDADCRERYLRAASSRRPRSEAPGSAGMVGERGEELASLWPLPSVESLRSEASMEARGWPLAVVVLALGVAALPGEIASGLAALALTGVAGYVAVRAERAREESGFVAWISEPVGVALLALSGMFADRGFVFFASAALGVAMSWGREQLARRSGQPVDALLRELKARVPQRVRMSVLDASTGADVAPARESETASVRTGEEVLVDAGDVVPVDGVVAAGEGRVLTHPGAQVAVWRRSGQALLAGARVIEGSLRITATRVGDARALFRPASFGLEGAPGSAALTRAATRVRSPLLGVLFAAFALGLAAAFASDVRQVLAGTGVALLVFPTLAIVRGVKQPFVSASALAASRGIVFRDAVTLERAGRVSAAALCTDGTVTQGTCNLIEVSPLGRPEESRELTAMAMGAELSAEPHPIAEAVRCFGEERGIEPMPLRRVAYQRGRGVTALVDGGGALVLGNRQSLLASGVSVAVADREAQRAESQGRTVIFLAVGGRVRALFIFEDPVRGEARAAVQQLIDLAVEVVLLSGDHRTTVESLARTVDITHVKAELTSEERAAEVGRLREAGGVVAVIGRAQADELPLAAADIALTLDAAGSALEGDVAVASEDLRDAADALVIAHRARRTAQTVLAVGVGGGIVLAVAGALSVLSPPLVLLLGFGIDAWALPSAARLLRRGEARPRSSLRSASGWFRRA